MANSPVELLAKGKAPLGMRMAIAEGLLPLEGNELVKALGFLVHDKNAKVIAALNENLAMLPRVFLQSTSQLSDCEPDLLHFMSEVLIEDDEIMQSIVLNRSVADKTLIHAAKNANSHVLEILAQNKNRMLECPEILDTLLENTDLSRVTLFSLEEFADRFLEEAGDGTAEPSIDEDVQEDVEAAVATATLEAEESPVDQTAELDGIDDLDGLPDLDEGQEREPDTSVEDDVAVETDFSAGLAEDDFKDIKGFDSGWDIDDLVKQVAGDEMSSSGADGFDDVLDIAVLDEDEDEDGAESWLGDDIAELAEGLDLDEDVEDDDKSNDDELVDTRIRLMKMSASDKLVLAQMGSKQERAILVTDPNKKVAVAVVEGPKMSEYEIARIASNRQVYEEVLRAISKHREWGKSNAIRRELVLNPKTPLAIAVRMLSSLNEYILKDVVKSKDLPNALTNQAKRVLTVREKRRGS